MNKKLHWTGETPVDNSDKDKPTYELKELEPKGEGKGN